MKAIAFFLFSAVVGSILDGFHTFSGTTQYTHAFFAKMALWTPLIFGAAGLAIALTHRAFDAATGRPRPSLSTRDIVIGFAIFTVVYFASGFLPASNAVKLLLLAAVAIGMWWQYDRTWQGVVMIFVTAIIGCAAEWGLTSLGVFMHLQPDLFAVPMWLPALYAVASVAIGNWGRIAL